MPAIRTRVVRPRWNAQQPYDELPLLPPRGDLETREVLKLCISARTALGELKQAAELIPNPGVLINTLPMLEAKTSSEIENIVTTSDKLFRYREELEDADAATREAWQYSQALLEAYQSLQRRPLTTRTAEQICSRIKGVEMRVRRVPGVALARGSSGKIIYTPPGGEDRLRTLLANWERFMHEATGLDPLVRMAVAHYQFEAIHPFTDGNGRTGRVLNSLYLISENLLTLPILYLSRYVIHHKADYYRLLLEVTSKQAWEKWILFVVRGVEETAKWTMGKILAIRALQQQATAYVRAKEPKIYSHELLNAVFELPYCRIQNLTDRGVAGRQTASVYLKKLVRIGVLQEITAGREKLFIHRQLLDLLTSDTHELPPYGRAKTTARK